MATTTTFTTGRTTFNNVQGNLAADPQNHNVYDIYAAGMTGFLKAHTFTPNHIIVSRSTDMGKTWTANVAFTAPAGTSPGNIFPALAVDPTNGNLYAVWPDGHKAGFGRNGATLTHSADPEGLNPLGPHKSAP